VKEILANEMEQAAKLSVPLDVEMQVGKNWYEAK
jgi:DNA polymerase I-like protein with 3'-5' exonuclease and polymerase domains